MAVAQGGYAGPIAAIKCGVAGLAANLNPSSIRVKNVIQAEGTVFRQDHWRKEPGSFLFGTNTNPASDPDKRIVALVDWHPTEDIARIVHLRGDGHLYFTDPNPGETGDPGANISTTTSGSGTDFGFFVVGGSESASPVKRKLFLFRKNKLPTFVAGDGTNDIVITLPATDWTDDHPPIVGLINNTRLWAAGNANNPHQLYASKADDQTDFQTVNGLSSDFQTLSMFPGVGERIYALRNYQGFIVIFKYPRGIFLQDARDTDPLNWLQQQVTDQIGIAQSPYAALQLENDVLFIGSDGQFYLLSAVISAAQGQNNLAIANLSMDLEIYQFLLNAFNRGLLSQVQSVYQPFWQTATFTIPGPSSSRNNTRLVFDFNKVGRVNTGGEPRFSYSYRDKASALALRRDPSDFIDKPMFGDYDSHIILLEQDARITWDMVPYTMRVQTPHTNLGEFENLEGADGKFVQFANRNKEFDNLEIEFVPLTPASLTVQVFVDGVLKQTFDVALPFSGTPLDSFILDTDTLGATSVRTVVRRLNCGSGRRISFSFLNTANDEDIALTHLFIGFRPADTTQTPRK